MSPKAIKKNPICEKLHNLVTLLIGEFIEADKEKGGELSVQYRKRAYCTRLLRLEIREDKIPLPWNYGITHFKRKNCDFTSIWNYKRVDRNALKLYIFCK